MGVGKDGVIRGSVFCSAPRCRDSAICPLALGNKRCFVLKSRQRGTGSDQCFKTIGNGRVGNEMVAILHQSSV